MKIIADDQIPLLDELFPEAVLIKKPGAHIQRADLIDADMLLVRTLTRVDAALLAGTAVRFVGTATAGYDHLDIQWLSSQGIAWAYAPGANAVAVVEYVLCAIAALQTQGVLCGQSLRAGVIGVGQVGAKVAQALSAIGMQVIVNDPPRAAREPAFDSVPLAEFRDLDLICLHPALVKTGDYPSFHLLNDDFLARQQPGMVLLNASRGAVLDTQVLLRQHHLRLCLDVWESEPEINLALLNQAQIATPHIAAYSLNAKHQASRLLYRQAKVFFSLRGGPVLPFENEGQHERVIKPISSDWKNLALAKFNPLALTAVMQQFLLTDTATRFLKLRKEYPWRESFLDD